GHRAFDIVPLIFRDIRYSRVLTQLQCPDVGSDRPAILRIDLRGVVEHRAEAIGHNVIEMAERYLLQAGLMVGRRMLQASLHDRAIAVTDAGMARSAIDVIALLTAEQQLAHAITVVKETSRKIVRHLSIALAGIEIGVSSQLVAGNGVLYRHPRTATV